MEERVTRLGGTFGIDSEIGGGTILTVELPLAGQNEEGSAELPAGSVYEGEPNSNSVGR
jgi:signal transduction histidine kinase